MAYASTNFKTKKQLKDAVAAGKQVTVWSPGPFQPEKNGKLMIEGPHKPEPHKWYATAEVVDGVIVKVK
jgi:hypothetical protein